MFMAGIVLVFMGIYFAGIALLIVLISRKRFREQKWESAWGEVTKYFWQDKSAVVAFELDGKIIECKSQYLGKEIPEGEMVRIKYDRSRLRGFYPDSNMVKGRVFIETEGTGKVSGRALPFIFAGIFGLAGVAMLVTGIFCM